MKSLQSESVELVLPLRHRHASTVRVVAASLAADLGFTIDEIDELRLGVDEAVSVLADVDADHQARLHLLFELDRRSISVTASRSGVPERLTNDHVDELAARILRAVVDHFEVNPDGAFVVVKHSVSHGD